jgi:SNF2 family DNA or RNA helicase
VAPLSLIGKSTNNPSDGTHEISPMNSHSDQWKSELQAWAPDFNVVLFHGPADVRDFLVKQVRHFPLQLLKLLRK